MGKRYAEAGGGLYAAMRAIAVKDHARMLDMHAKRLCEDHKIQQIAAGFRSKEEGFECQDEVDDMGDISITGDQYHYQVPTTTNNTESSLVKWLPLALLAVATPASLLIGYLLADKPEIKPIDTDTDTVISVSVE